VLYISFYFLFSFMAKKTLNEAEAETLNPESAPSSSECSSAKNCCGAPGGCNRRFWIGAAFRIAFVVACIVGAFFLGMYVKNDMGYGSKCGYGRMSDHSMMQDGGRGKGERMMREGGRGEYSNTPVVAPSTASGQTVGSGATQDSLKK
jgi:hypothetical protein